MTRWKTGGKTAGREDEERERRKKRQRRGKA